MGIIIKFILKNIKEKKLRTFLILLSITLSASLFFASSAISGTIGDKFVQRMRQFFGSADIIAVPTEDAESKYFFTDRIQRYRGNRDFEYVIGMFSGVGIYRRHQEKNAVELWGYDWRELQRFNRVYLEQEAHLLPFDGDKVIIGAMAAKKYRLKLGGNLDIDINEVKHRFRICGIASTGGPFQAGDRTMTAIVPRKTLSTLYDARGMVSVAFIKLRNPSKKKAVIDDLSKTYRRQSFRASLSPEEIAEFTRGISTGFLMMCTLILFMSIFIIYTSFKVITRERLPVIGTFRSIGATKKMTDFVLFAESILYGTVGGALGCGLGIGILYLMSFIMTPPWVKGVPTTIQFSPIHLISAFLLALILSFASAFVQVVRISKIPVKDIVLNSIERSGKKKGWKLPVGSICLALAMLLPPVAPQSVALWVNMGCMLGAIAASILLIPFLTNGFLAVFERIYIVIFGNEGVLAAKNLRDDKNILNNIALLTIGISSLLMINTVSDSVFKELTNFYRDARFQIWMGIGEANRGVVQRILSTDGVVDAMGIYGGNNTPIKGRKEQIMLIHGVKGEKYFQYWHFNIEGDPALILRGFDTSRNILLSRSLGNRLGVQRGDRLILKMKRGDKPYRIAGFFNSLMWNGSYALIPETYCRMDMEQHYFQDIFIKTSGSSPDRTKKALEKKFIRERPWIGTIRQMKEDDMKNNQQIFSILQGFSVMTLLIGVFGVLNNLLISFISRRRSMAVMRSVGMTRRQMVKMIFIESLTGGLIGGVAGVLTGIVLISIVPYVMRTIDMPIPIHYAFGLFGYSMIAGVVITILASVGPALKSSKLNIIDAIKYE